MTRLLAALAFAALPLTASAADLASRKAPAPAQPVFTAFDSFISAGTGYGWSTSKGIASSTDLNGMPFEARGTFFAALNSTLGVQADGEFSRKDIKADGLDVSTYTGTLAAHAFTRNSTGLVGLFVQGDSNSDTIGGSAGQNRRYFAGVEGQYFMGNTTLYGQLAYQSQQYVDLPGATFSPDGVNMALQARNYLTPDLMIALKGEYQYLSGDLPFNGAAKQDAWRLSARGEYRFAATPFSLYADLSHQQTKLKVDVASFKENDTRAMVGMKINFGTKTLQERDRSGASLDAIRALKLNAPLVMFYLPPV